MIAARNKGENGFPLKRWHTSLITDCKSKPKAGSFPLAQGCNREKNNTISNQEIRLNQKSDSAIFPM